jgi:hypothetical protein
VSRDHGNGSQAEQLYIDLVKRCILELPSGDTELPHRQPLGRLPTVVLELVKKAGSYVHGAQPDFSDDAHWMLGRKRLDKLQDCIEIILGDDVPGDFIETGVKRGGAVLLMRAILKAYGITDRVVWATDAFEGQPAPERVRRNFERYGLLDNQLRILHGWFREMLATAPVGRLALLRLDGEDHQSILDALAPLYPKLSPGGFVIIDDYHLPVCARAVQEYREREGIREPIHPIDGSAVYWRRSQEAARATGST